MSYSLDKKSLQVATMKSWVRTDEEKPIILIRTWKGDIPTIGKRGHLVLVDGREISTSPIRYILLGGQIYIETESTIYLDKKTWEEMCNHHANH